MNDHAHPMFRDLLSGPVTDRPEPVCLTCCGRHEIAILDRETGGQKTIPCPDCAIEDLYCEQHKTAYPGDSACQRCQDEAGVIWAPGLPSCERARDYGCPGCKNPVVVPKRGGAHE